MCPFCPFRVSSDLLRNVFTKTTPFSARKVIHTARASDSGSGEFRVSSSPWLTVARPPRVLYSSRQEARPKRWPTWMPVLCTGRYEQGHTGRVWKMYGHEASLCKSFGPRERSCYRRRPSGTRADKYESSGSWLLSWTAERSLSSHGEHSLERLQLNGDEGRHLVCRTPFLQQ